MAASGLEQLDDGSMWRQGCELRPGLARPESLAEEPFPELDRRAELDQRVTLAGDLLEHLPDIAVAPHQAGAILGDRRVVVRQLAVDLERRTMGGLGIGPTARVNPSPKTLFGGSRLLGDDRCLIGMSGCVLAGGSLLQLGFELANA